MALNLEFDTEITPINYIIDICPNRRPNRCKQISYKITQEENTCHIKGIIIKNNNCYFNDQNCKYIFWLRNDFQFDVI